jgi:Mrp family chromosome partitioning ATPase
MEKIKQAVERAKGARATRVDVAPAPSQVAAIPLPAAALNENQSGARRPDGRVIELDARHLEAHRLISWNVGDPRTRSFDMLRTQVLQSLDARGWRSIAVTSPTPACGKTVTAINLAFSIARQEDRSALLVDLDLQRPQVAGYLGIQSQKGLISVLQGRTNLTDSILETRVRGYSCSVLPAETASLHSSEIVGSRAMRATLHEIKMSSPNRVTIFDMPPTLSGDEVISVIPQIDCVLLVTAVGVSTVQEVVECSRLLQATEVVRIVLNKSSASTPVEYY